MSFVRNAWPQAAVWASGIVMADPFAKNAAEVPFIQRNDEIQALASNGTDQPYESDAQADSEEEDGASDRFASGGTEDGHQETQKRPRGCLTKRCILCGSSGLVFGGPCQSRLQTVPASRYPNPPSPRGSQFSLGGFPTKLLRVPERSNESPTYVRIEWVGR